MKRKHLVRLASTACAAVMAAASIPFSSSLSQDFSLAAETLKYEFENGKATQCFIYPNGLSDVPEDKIAEGSDLSGFSGKGFAYLDQKNSTLTVDVEVPEAGLYDLTIGYCEPSDPNKKVQYLYVNGVDQGEVTFPYCSSFSETSGGVVKLNKGKNTIQLKAYWGYTFFDYLTLAPADERLSKLSPDASPCNPDASDSAKRLYKYLRDQYGKHIIAGQQEYCGSHNYNQWNDPDTYIKDNEKEFEYILDKTGKQPAIRGIDLLAYNTSSDWRDDAPERAIEWTNKYHGIVTMTWHWNVPSDEECSKDGIAFYVESTGNNPFTTFSISKALEEGTWENKKILADIDLIAQQLKKLKDADVPILFRPLHEAEGAWFWWGAEGPEPCKQLYRLLYDKLTNEYGLNNLIWEWTSSTSAASADWYPGDDVVDIIGCDKYNANDGKPNLSSIASTFFTLVKSTDCHKMVAMTENDSIPSLENLVNDSAGWLYFCPWYQNYLQSETINPVESLNEIYNSDYCITLDELPDLKKYPLDEEPATDPASETNSTTEKTPEADLLGDANCDTEINMSDVVLVMQDCLNPQKYGVNGTSNDRITEKGEENADVDADGSVSTNDALIIQKFSLKLISKF